MSHEVIQPHLCCLARAGCQGLVSFLFILGLSRACMGWLSRPLVLVVFAGPVYCAHVREQGRPFLISFVRCGLLACRGGGLGFSFLLLGVGF